MRGHRVLRAGLLARGHRGRRQLYEALQDLSDFRRPGLHRLEAEQPGLGQRAERLPPLAVPSADDLHGHRREAQGRGRPDGEHGLPHDVADLVSVGVGDPRPVDVSAGRRRRHEERHGGRAAQQDERPAHLRAEGHQHGVRAVPGQQRRAGHPAGQAAVRGVHQPLLAQERNGRSAADGGDHEVRRPERARGPEEKHGPSAVVADANARRDERRHGERHQRRVGQVPQQGLDRGLERGAFPQRVGQRGHARRPRHLHERRLQRRAHLRGRELKLQRLRGARRHVRGRPLRQARWPRAARKLLAVREAMEADARHRRHVRPQQDQAGLRTVREQQLSVHMRDAVDQHHALSPAVHRDQSRQRVGAGAGHGPDAEPGLAPVRHQHGREDGPGAFPVLLRHFLQRRPGAGSFIATVVQERRQPDLGAGGSSSAGPIPCPGRLVLLGRAEPSGQQLVLVVLGAGGAVGCHVGRRAHLVLQVAEEEREEEKTSAIVGSQRRPSGQQVRDEHAVQSPGQ
mmetsp:Transcript_103212/g.315813  ORF Transcript_103212/g.315813 Transcript_103212/m.315813 type:complete len:513 (-) Transcript_103212:585-2123(-)